MEKNGPKQRGREKQRVEGGEEAVSVVPLHSTEWRGGESRERGGSVVVPYSQPQVESIMKALWNIMRAGLVTTVGLRYCSKILVAHAQKLR